MDVQENIPLGRRTTMRIGGTAHYFAELKTREDVEAAQTFSSEHHVPIIVLGAGSNTIFADGTIEALVVQVKAETVTIDGNRVTAEAGRILANLINDCAKQNLDLSSLTGIPGTVGGAIVGNAGQGPGGIWIDRYVDTITAFIDGAWKTFTREDCDFRYRQSTFKDTSPPPVIWDVTLTVPAKPEVHVKAEIERLLQKRIATQPHLKTAGSCFKAVGKRPAWQLIDAAGMRGYRVGEVEIAEKHANFLLNTGRATFADTVQLITDVKKNIPENLEVEMRLYRHDGSLAF